MLRLRVLGATVDTGGNKGRPYPAAVVYLAPHKFPAALLPLANPPAGLKR